MGLCLSQGKVDGHDSTHYTYIGATNPARTFPSNCSRWLDVERLEMALTPATKDAKTNIILAPKWPCEITVSSPFSLNLKQIVNIVCGYLLRLQGLSLKTSRVMHLIQWYFQKRFI